MMHHLHKDMPQPTPEQVKMTERVQRAVCHEINLLAKEGVPVACLLTGLTMTIADLLTTQGDSKHVAPWFEAQAQMARELQAASGKHN
jgi:hypothetical protein